MTKNASKTGPTQARRREKAQLSARKHERSENAKGTGKTWPSIRSQPSSSCRISHSSLLSRFRVKSKSPLRLCAFGSLLALLALAAGGWLLQRRAEPAVFTGDRPENATEGRRLRAALARPADAGAQEALGQYYLRAGDPFEALWALQRARDAGEARGQGSVGLAMADALESAGLRERALALVTDGAARHPADLSLALRRAELQLRLGQPAAAVATLRSFAAIYPTPYTLHPTPYTLLFGRALEAAGDDAAALAEYRRILAAAPGSVEARFRVGRLLVRRGPVAEGRAALEAAHQLAPASPEPCYALGLSFMKGAATDPLPAVRWFRAALQAAPGYAPAQVALGRLYLLHRQWVDAARQLEAVQNAGAQEPEVLLGLAEVLAATGYTAEAHQRRGMAYALQGKLPQALDEFRALEAAEPGSRDASLLISQVLIQMGRNAEAAVEIKAAADRYPRDVELKERLANLYIDSLTRDGARQLCEEWLRSDPAAAKPLWLLGRTELFSPVEFARAIDHLERAARLAPRDPQILFSLAEALSRSTPQQDRGRAFELLSRAVALAPREARYRYQMGLLLQQVGRAEQARREFLRALDLNPGMTAAYAGLVGISGQLREPGQIALFAPVIREQQEAKREETERRRATYRSPKDPAAYAALARCLEARGDLQQARAQWEVVLTLAPDDAAAQREMARVDRILGVL